MSSGKKEITLIQRMLNSWAVVVIIWSVYRAYFKTDLPIWFDEFIAKPLVFLLPVYYFINKYEKQSFFHAVDFFIKRKKDILFGILSGLIVFSFGIVIYYKNHQVLFPRISPLLLFYVVVALASSISEEILSRGFVLKRLYADSKNIFTSVFFASFLFFMLHIPILFTNPSMRGTVLLQVMLTDFILSFGVSLAYLKTKNILVAIIIHAFYNLGIYLAIVGNL